MTNFNNFVNRLYSLSDSGAYKNEIESFLEFHDSNIVKFVNREKGVIMLHKKELKSSDEIEYDVVQTSMAEELRHTAVYFCNHPTKIIGNLSNQRLKRTIKDWADKLTTAELIISNDAYFKIFPEYHEAISILRKKLVDLLHALNIQKNVRGKKSSLSLSDQAKIISEGEKLLKSNPEEYSPRSGAYVSQRLKHAVNDNLEGSIPDLTFYKVDRLLYEYFYAKKSSLNTP